MSAKDNIKIAILGINLINAKKMFDVVSHKATL